MISEVAANTLNEVSKNMIEKGSVDISKRLDVGIKDLKNNTNPVDITKRIDSNKNEINPLKNDKLTDYEKNFKDIPDDTPLDKIEKPGLLPEVKSLKDIISDYINDLKDKSSCPETLSDVNIDDSKFEVQPHEVVAKLRDEFDDKTTKNNLRKEWETLHNTEWPKYDKEVLNEDGKVIRKPGDNYDAHHIQPLSAGGKNEASNLTPLHVNKHSEIHSGGGSCDKLDKKIQGGF